MWVPNPVSVLGNAVNDESFYTWVTEVYTPANFKYLPLPILMSLFKSHQQFTAEVPAPYLGWSRTMKPVHGTVLYPRENPPATLVRNWFVTALKEGLFKGTMRVLMPNGGALGGVLPLVLTSLKGFQGHVHVLDPDKDSIKNIQFNYHRLRHGYGQKKRWKSIKLEPSSFLTPRDRFSRFNAVVFNPPWLAGIEPSIDWYYDLDGQTDGTDWLPGRDLFGRKNILEDFFEEAQYTLDAEGYVVLLWSNLGNIIEGTQEHPVVKELEENDRYLLHHFEDVPWKFVSRSFIEKQPHPFIVNLTQRVRVELWVLKLNRKYLPEPPLVEVAPDPDEDETALSTHLESQISTKRADQTLLTNYFHPPQIYTGNYSRTALRRSKFIKEGGKPDPSEIERRNVEYAKELVRQREELRKSKVRDTLRTLGIKPIMPKRRWKKDNRDEGED
eukprot:TRINITY_DN47065_c0_g1_i1.p1 TRINITY_DN47065_c0_g1~~TRINITY_DN47065_c0_g1_i1.p1  ORF type:complete len:503 (+),score=75.73 TRINITY_DN47065_c0_g1_i1:184-1509(+)